MKKRMLSLILALCIFAACIPTASAYSNVSSWAKDAVDGLYDLGFLPKSLENADMTRTITRGEMCSIAVAVYNNFLGTPEAGPDSTSHFDDTKDPDICYAYEQGIVSGYSNEKFGPNDPLTREQFFKITYNMMTTAYWDPNSITPASLSRFSDAGKVSDYAKVPTSVMVAIGVVQGDGTKLKPQSHTSCQEAITMFFRAYEYMCQWINQRTEENKSVQIYSQGYSGISSWAIREVQEMQEKGLIPACLNNCNMSKAITRAQMCAIAVGAYEKATGSTYSPTGKNHFTDTSDALVNAAYELGIVGGYGNGKFGPNDTLTREQFFKIMANFMKTLDYSREDSRAVSLSSYKDGNKVASWAQAPARLMIYIGAVRGDGNNLTPKNDTTIQEAIAIFLRCYKYTVAWKETHPNGEPSDEYTQLINDVVAFALSFEGYPYVYGGGGPNNFDCSGLVYYVYKHFGYSIPHGATSQYKSSKVTHVGMDDLMPGDLVFFSKDGGKIMYHVGLYIGDGEFIHASTPTRGVVIDSVWDGYYYDHFYCGGRIITD